MPFDIDAIANDVATVEVVWGQHAFKVSYHPSKYTDDVLRRWNQPEDRNSPERINRHLAALLADWELERGGARIPLTEEGIGSVPPPVKLAIYQAVENDLLNPTTSAARPTSSPAPTATSSPGSPPEANSAPTTGLTASPIGSA